MTQIRERLGQALFLRVAGPDGPQHRDRIHYTEGPRWFASDSAIARVHGDASMFIGGIRALLLQTLHPAAMRAVSEHSGFRGDMWGRLNRTSRFLAVTTFGTADDAEQAIAIVRSIHERVTGTMPDGTPYAASDPHLLTWIHIAEIDSFLRAHTVYGKEPLDQVGRDQYVAQAGEIARRLGAEDVPTTEAELAAALAAYRPELRGTPDAREAVRFLLFKPPLPLAARAPYGVLIAAAVGLMPAWTRRHLRLPWLPISERTVVRALGSVATGTIRWAMTPPRS
ncbi:MAG: oxygenase MpaB family protein [Nocardioides sp.]